MKKLSKILAAVMCAAVVLGTIMIPTTALAAESTTYVVRFGGEWVYEYQKDVWMGVGSIDSILKDGDKIVVEDTGIAPTKNLEITTTKKLSEFAVTGNVTGVLTGNVDYAYGVNGGTVVVNGTVSRVSIYAGNTVQINGNAGYVETTYADGNNPKFAVTGTVDHFVGRVSDGKTSPSEVYDIPAGKCKSGDDGYVWLDTADMHTSSTKVATTATPAKNTAKELDEVPKTGLTASGTVICFAMGAICALGAVLVAGKKKQEF